MMFFLLNPDAKAFIPGTSPQQRALRGQPEKLRGSVQRGYECTTGRMGVSALAGTAAPRQRKPRRVPRYETESHFRHREEKQNKKKQNKEVGTSLTSAGKERSTPGS